MLARRLRGGHGVDSGRSHRRTRVESGDGGRRRQGACRAPRVGRWPATAPWPRRAIHLVRRVPDVIDAPAATESDTTFAADSFLTASPDALISRESFPVFGSAGAIQLARVTRTSFTSRRCSTEAIGRPRCLSCARHSRSGSSNRSGPPEDAGVAGRRNRKPFSGYDGRARRRAGRQRARRPDSLNEDVGRAAEDERREHVGLVDASE